MKRSACVLFLLAGLVSSASAQPSPHLGYVYPAGGRVGTQFEVHVGGQFLDGVTKAHFSGGGMRVELTELVKPLSQKEINDLREKLKALQEKRQAQAKADKKPNGPSAAKPSWTAADEKMIQDIRRRIARSMAKKLNPTIAQMAVLQVSLAENAEPGRRELRLETPAGLSNPMVFCVDQLPELVKKPPEPGDLPPGPLRNVRQQGLPTGPQRPATEITLPVVVNGQLRAGEVDRYRFRARRGQHLVVVANARELIPYLADAVPGWFQAALTLFDDKGKELAFAGSYRFHPDPVLHCQIPADGSYTIEIKDSVFRGREDFVYRVALGELPFVTNIFPMGGPVGEKTSVEFTGWNLSSERITQDGQGKLPGIRPLELSLRSTPINRMPFALDVLPECRAIQPGSGAPSAQRITVPTIVNGRIAKPGDQAVFRFDGRTGQTVVAEVYARRLDSPLDSVLVLTDSTGKQLAANDDQEDQGWGLLTHHADSWLKAVLPADGAYELRLRDTQHQGGPDYTYRLRISALRPDFELRVAPSSLNGRPGVTLPITVLALRRDEFDGPIALSLEGAPAGFRLGGEVVPPGQQRLRVTLTFPSTPLTAPVEIHMTGRATIDGKEVVRAAIPTDDMMQAFIYRHLVPAQQWMVTTANRGRGGVPLVRRDWQPVKLPAGGTVEVRFSGVRGPAMRDLHFTLNEPPEGIAVEKTIHVGDDAIMVLSADAAKIKPGWKGNLIVEVALERPAESKDGKGKQGNRRNPMGTLPAVPVEIVGR